MKNKIINIFLVLILLCGIGVLSYPFISNILLDRKQDQILTEYNEEMEKMSDAEIEEEKEEWQVRLAILLKEDIVQKKLSRDEMNNEIACFFIAGTILSVISIWLLPKDYIGTHLYVGLISLAAVVGLLIIGTCSANMKVHLTLLLLGAVVQPVGFFTIGTLMGSGYIVCRDTAVLKQYVIYLYGGAFILAII